MLYEVITPEWTRRGVFSLIALLLPPLLVVALLQQLLSDSLFGIPGLLFAGAILLFSLGPVDLDTQVNDYTRAVETDDEEPQRQIAREIVEDEPPTSEPAFSQARITSYNVCYTKLLRDAVKGEVGVR